MSNHKQTLVPISTWCYCSPELGYKGYALDIGLMAEALIYYENVFINITNQPQFASFIEWFVKQGKYDKFLSLVSDGTIQFYDYSFQTAAVTKDGVMSIWNIQDTVEEKPNTFDQRFLYHKSVQAVLPTGRKRKHFYTALRDRVIEVKASEFEISIENARRDAREPRRNALILQSFVDELYRFRGLGHSPQIEVNVVPSINERIDVTWNINFDELTKLAGKELNFHAQTPLNANAISNRFIWSAANLNCDLYLPKPMSIVTGDKLYETGLKALKNNSIIDTLQKSVEFPDVRTLVNEGKLDLDDVLSIRKKAGKFRKWLQSEGERDRDALIAYHNEVAKDSGFTKVSRVALNIFGIMGGAAIDSIVESQLPGLPGAAIGAVSVAGTEYLFDVARKINQDWKPVVFGEWMKQRIENLLDDLKEDAE
jgi:hypothetical protein